jgi:hypothetical protein
MALLSEEYFDAVKEKYGPDRETEGIAVCI